MGVVGRAAGDPAVLFVQGLDVIPVELVVRIFSRYGPWFDPDDLTWLQLGDDGIVLAGAVSQVEAGVDAAQPSASSAWGGSVGAADADEVGEGSTDDDGSTDEVGSTDGDGLEAGADDDGLRGGDATAASPSSPFTNMSRSAVTMTAKTATAMTRESFSRSCHQAGGGEGLWLGLNGRCGGKLGVSMRSF